jgi:hypothetical protein
MSVSEADSGPTVHINRDWEPHPKQEQILHSDARFRVIAAGRRFGKTETAAHDLFEYALGNPDSLCWWVAPTYDIADTGFKILKRIIPEGVIDGSPKTSKPKRIDLGEPSNSRIEFRSTDREDGLRSEGLDYVVLDEAAMIPKRAWSAELRPALSDTLGKMIAISTPKGANWFKDYFERGQLTGDDDPDGVHEHIASWHAPTESNPHIPASEVHDAKRELPERIFKQEYLAKFLDDSGGVFKKVRERIVADEYDHTEHDGSPPYHTGVDFARQQNYTVITTLDGNGTLVHYDRVRQESWPHIQDRVETAYEKYPGVVAVDASRDNKIVGDLDRAGVYVEPVNFSSSKTELIENLITAVEQREITVPDLSQLITELQAFEYGTTSSGNVTYSAPEGFHDDSVDSLALAQHARVTEFDGGGGSGTATWGSGADNAPDGKPGARGEASSGGGDGTFTIDVR